MAESKRRLAAILAADVAGYSRLMADDEHSTLDTLNTYRQIFKQQVSHHDGRVVDTAGDSVLAVFDSVVESVDCAVEIQSLLLERNQELSENRRMEFRIGINLGDVIEQDDGTIYGDGVNVAARIESLATPNGITLSESAHMQVRSKLDFAFDDIGQHEVKNIADPVQVYRVDTTATGENAVPNVVRAQSDKPSIAVLPFDNLSQDPDQEYFADGVSEDLITALSRLRWLFVAARNSTFTYKDSSIDVTQIARELGVRYVVDGSVRKSGERVRVSAQLIEANAGRQLWAQRYDRKLTDLFDLQDEIVEMIAAAIEPELGLVERERAHRKRPENLDVWESHQQAMWFVYRFNQQDNLRARELFETAIGRDPDFPQARAGLAYAHYLGWLFAFTEVDLDYALDSARCAVSIDPREPFAQMALGRVYQALGQHDEAIASLSEAISLNPSMAIAHYALGLVRMQTAQMSPAIECFDQAIRLSPRDPLLWVFETVRSEAYARCGDLDKALTDAQQSTRRPFANFYAFGRLACIHAYRGENSQASEALSRALDLQPDLSPELFSERFGSTDPNYIDWWSEGLGKAGLVIADK